MNTGDVLIHSIKEEYTLEFDILHEAISTIPHSVRIYVPRDVEPWLKENCEADCYLATIDRQHLDHVYLAMFVDRLDAVHYKMVWGR